MLTFKPYLYLLSKVDIFHLCLCRQSIIRLYNIAALMVQLFESVAGQFQSVTQYERFIKECQKEYDIKVYRLSSFPVAQARKIYSQLAQKYRNKLMEPNPHGWYQNQRRLYVWFVLCFVHYKVLDSSKFVDSYQKYWRAISEVFWQKEVYFLKYQLLTICKAKGRTVWREKEDLLLKKIFGNFKLGEWNEIAKQFYKESGGEFFKTPKQCRQRWQNHLNQGIRKGDWSKEEDLIIFQYVGQNQRKNWAQIAKLFNQTRTQHMIKNRYKSLTTKMMTQREITEQQAAKVILNNLLKKPQEQEQKQQEFEIKEVESQALPASEDGKQPKSPKRQSQIMNPTNLMDMNSLAWMKSDRRGNNSILWPIGGQSINGFNRSISNFNSSMLIFDNSIILKFPSSDAPKEEDRKNTIFDPSESIVNSAKNADSIIVKIISDN